MVCDFFHPRLGGVENHIWSLSHHLQRQGHKVIVITHAYYGTEYQGVHYFESSSSSSSSSSQQQRQRPLKVYYCPILPLVDQDALPTFTATLPLIRSILIRERIDIVHGHQATSAMANECVAYAHVLGLKSVYTDHSLFGFDDVAGVVLNRVLQTTLCTVDAAIAVSYACRDNFILRTTRRAIYPKNVVTVIPNAIDPSKFVPDPSQRPTDRIRVVVVSRLVYRKGVDLLVGIIPEICHALPNVDFLIGGDGSKLLALQEMVEEERLEDRVTFLGAIPHHTVRNVLVQGHVFLNCSLTESFCIAILEAASAGLLVVSTNVGGVPEVLPSPSMARLADPNVPSMVQELKAAIVQQTNHPLDPWQLHRDVRSMYSWERVALETEQVYNRITQTTTETKKKSWAWLLWTRVTHYYTALDGGIAGAVAALVAFLLSVWLCVVETLQPKSGIEVLPDFLDGESVQTRYSLWQAA
ncbi:hypothetical protein ACA910_015804 [Epithemia clementina (nom. ined.)]